MAHDCFTELSIALAICGFSCLFVTSLSAIATLLIATTCVVSFNALFRFVKLRATLKLDKEERIGAQKTIYRMMGWNFAFLDSGTRDILTHEFGHAFFSSLFYKNRSLSVSLFPFMGGVTNYFPEALTFVGSLVGENAAELIVSAAGPLTTLFFSLLTLTIAHFVKESHPQLNQYLNACTLLSLTQQIFYALSALGTPLEELSHDFVYLWAMGGIHPLAACLFICLVPLIIKIIVSQIAREEQTAPSLKERAHLFSTTGTLLRAGRGVDLSTPPH